MIEETWIDEYEDEFNILDFEDITKLNVVFIYVENNEIFLVKKNSIAVVNNFIDNDFIMNLIMKYNTLNTDKYSVTQMFLYNIHSDITALDDNFISELSHYKYVTLEKSIKLLKHLNSLYFIMTKLPVKRNLTKKVYISTNNRTRKNK